MLFLLTGRLPCWYKADDPDALLVSPSLISLMVSVDVKYHVYLLKFALLV